MPSTKLRRMKDLKSLNHLAVRPAVLADHLERLTAIQEHDELGQAQALDQENCRIGADSISR